MTFELYGTARLRAGIAKVSIPAGSVGRALEQLAASCPALAGPVVVGESVHPAFLLSLNGDRFVSDPATPLSNDDCLLLLSADAGG